MKGPGLHFGSISLLSRHWSQEATAGSLPTPAPGAPPHKRLTALLRLPALRKFGHTPFTCHCYFSRTLVRSEPEKAPPNSNALADTVHSGPDDIAHSSLLHSALLGSAPRSTCPMWDTWQCADQPEHSTPRQLSPDSGPTRRHKLGRTQRTLWPLCCGGRGSIREVRQGRSPCRSRRLGPDGGFDQGVSGRTGKCHMLGVF